MSSTATSAPPGLSIYETNKQIAVMTDLVDGSFTLDERTCAYMKAVRKICAKAAAELTGEQSIGVPLDPGQIKAALQLLQQVKNKACDAAIIGNETRNRAQATDANDKKRKVQE